MKLANLLALTTIVFTLTACAPQQTAQAQEHPTAPAQEAPTRPEMEIILESKNDFATTVARVKEAAEKEKFAVLFELDLQATVAKKDIIIEPTTILGVCSGKYSTEIMAEDIRIISQLPCRIGVYERDGKVYVASMNPKVLEQMYQGPSIPSIAKAVDGHVTNMMNYAISAP